MKKGAKKIVVTIIICFIILLCIALVTAPSWLMKIYGKGQIEKRLEKNLGGTWKIESIDLSWFSDQKFTRVQWNKEGATLEADAFIIKAPLWAFFSKGSSPSALLGKYPMSLENGSLTDQGNLLLSSVFIDLPHLEGNIASETQDKEFATFAKGQTNSELKKGKFLLLMTPSSPYEYKFTAKYLPTKILEMLSKKPVDLTLLIGPSLDIEAAGSISEKAVIDIDYNVNALNLASKGSGQYADSTFYATKNLYFTTRLTEKMSAYLFKNSKIRPISSDQIRITVDPKNAYIQLSPFSMSTLNADRIDVNLGRMIFKNMATLSDIISVLRLSPRFSDHIPIWFQSAILSVDKGLCDLRRTDFLVDNRYQIACWNLINFRNNTLNLYLGITSYALDAALGIKNLPNNYALPMRVDGPFDDPELHKSWALRAVAKLLVMQSHPLVRGIYPQPEVPVPPERRPFPWRS